MRFLLARHGETEWNVAGRRQGWLDSALTTAGRGHGELIASTVQREPIDVIFASPLGRAHTTAEIIASSRSQEIVVVDELAELNMGACNGLTNDEIEEQMPGALAERALSKYQWRFPDGESYADLDVRSARALETIRTHTCETCLIVSHSMVARMLVRNLLGIDADEALQFNMPHGAVLDVRPAAHDPIRWL